MNTTTSESDLHLEDLLSVKEFARRYRNICTSEDALRWQLRERGVNGMVQTYAVIKRGGRLYLNPPGYLRWLMHQQAA